MKPRTADEIDAWYDWRDSQPGAETNDQEPSPQEETDGNDDLA